MMGRVQATGDGLASEENLKDISISVGVKLSSGLLWVGGGKLGTCGKEIHLTDHHLIVMYIYISSYASEKNICTNLKSCRYTV